MNQATKSISSKIAIVFDFDETLIPDDSFEVLLQDCEIDIDSFKGDRIKPLIADGWDKYLARTYCLAQESQRRKNNKITKNKLIELGQKIKLCDGVDTMFERLQQKAQGKEIELEFYLISGGFVDIARSTSIAKYFKRMWGCELHYNEQGEIDFLQKQMTHTEKTRYLYYLSKGIEKDNEKDLIYNYQDFTDEQIHIPLDQVIYVGDGTSDIPCFTILNQYGGIAIGVYRKDRTANEWEHSEEISYSQRLSNLAPADYQEDSTMMRSLFLAIDSISSQIALRKLTVED